MNGRHWTRLRAPLTISLLLAGIATTSTPKCSAATPVFPDSTRTGLARSARDTSLAGWQRRLLLGLAAQQAPGEVRRTGASAMRMQSSKSDSDAQWVELSLPAPLGRDAPTTVYDPVRTQLIIFGGYDYSVYLSDVWTLSLDSSPQFVAIQHPLSEVATPQFTIRSGTAC